MIALAEAYIEHNPSFVEPSLLYPEGPQQRPRPSYHLHAMSGDMRTLQHLPTPTLMTDDAGIKARRCHGGKINPKSS